MRDEQPTDPPRHRRCDGSGTGSSTELVLATHQKYEVNWLVDSVPQAVAVMVSSGGRVVVAESQIPVGRLAVVADPFGNALVLIDLSAGTYVTDEAHHVVGVESAD